MDCGTSRRAGYFWDINLPGVPKAEGDRYRTTGVRIRVGPITAGLNFYTGDPGLTERERQSQIIDGRKTYINGVNGENPDKYRAGVFYLDIGPFRIGWNSEKIRNQCQNHFAHKDGEKYPIFRVLPIPPRQYWYFGFGTGNSLW